MKGETRFRIYKILYPLAWLYGLAVWMRNRLFDAGVISRMRFRTPVICIGNLTVGGTGKTPHTEYLIRLLCGEQRRVAVLSRGYKRKSKGFVLADEATPMEEIGDEPFQMKSKFPHITVAVDADRCEGVRLLEESSPAQRPDVVLLDDAYQHRYIMAGLNILLTDYNRPIYADALLPAGRLRESFAGRKRAQIIIVTKCPPGLGEEEAGNIRRRLRLQPGQKLYFTTLQYVHLQPFSAGEGSGNVPLPLSAISKEKQVILLTGIASPEKLESDLKAYTPHIISLRFADHHQFTASEAEEIRRTYNEKGKGGIIITTEKDATRLHGIGLGSAVESRLYVLPVEVKVLLGQAEEFNNNIKEYVRSHLNV